VQHQPDDHEDHTQEDGRGADNGQRHAKRIEDDPLGIGGMAGSGPAGIVEVSSSQPANVAKTESWIADPLRKSANPMTISPRARVLAAATSRMSVDAPLAAAKVLVHAWGLSRIASLLRVGDV
jgi:hypothetical protein